MRKLAAFMPSVIAVIFLHGFTTDVRGYDQTVADGQTFTSSDNISLADGDNTITVGTNGTADYSGIFSDPNATAHGRLVKAGPGLLILSGGNTYTGGTLLQSGTIRLDNNLSLNRWAAGGNQGTLTVTREGTIQISANRSISNRFLIGDNAASLQFDIAGGTSLTISGVAPQSTGTVSSSNYGGAISTGIMASRPLFVGGGNLELRENSAGAGGGLASNAAGGNAGFDLTELASLLIDGNKALGGNGGAIFVSTPEKTATSTLRLGDDITISNNSASTTSTSGDGGGFFITSTNNVLVEIGNHATFTENTAKRFGGAIYAFTSGVGFSADVVLGTNTLFDSNISQATAAAMMGGGAIYSTHNLYVEGNTFFKDNSATASGGAIFMYGREAGNLTLDTTSGDIAFTGNRGAGAANSIYLLQKTAVRVKGGNNVFFDDPLASYDFAGNTVGIGRAFGSTNASDNFTGIAQFRGTSQFLNNTSFEAADGRTRLGGGANVNSAQILGKTGFFTLGSNARLEGTGSIGFATNVLGGILAPDSAVFTANTWDNSSNAFVAGTGKTTIEGSETVGTLVFTGAAKFDGATILVDILGTNYDQIVVNNAVTFGATNNNIITITDAAVGGRYNIITLTTAAVGGNPSQYFTVSGNIRGSSSFGRYGATVQYGSSGGTNNVVQVVIGSTGGNTTLYWTGAAEQGATTGTWDKETTANWTDVPGGTAVITQFMDGDRVIFDTDHTVGPFNVNINPTGGTMIGAVGVADMLVTGSGNYTITGNITAKTADTNVADPTGKLVKEGAGTLTLNGTNDFQGGIDITDGVLVAKTADSVDGGTVEMSNNSTLQFDNSVSGTFASNITGDGNLVKSATGTLTLNGSNDYNGVTTVQAGTLVGNIASGTDLTVSGGATYQAGSDERTVSSLNGTGTVDMQGQTLKIGIEGTATGSGDFSGGVLTGINNFTKTGSGDMILGTKNLAATDSIEIAGNFLLEQGSLEIDRTPQTGRTEPKVDVTGTARFVAGTTLHVGRELALSAQNVVVEDGAVLDVCTCTGTGITLITSQNVIAKDFTYTIGGAAVVNTITLDVFVDGVNIHRTDDRKSIVIDAGGLVWNNTQPKSAHGTFNIGTAFQISQVLVDKSNDGRFYEEPVGTQAWDGRTLTKTGAGVLTLENAANSYSGGTLINRGTLISQAAGSTGSGAVNVANGAGFVLDFDGAFANALTGAGSLTIANSRAVSGATVTIDRDNTGFTATTTINEGAKLTMQHQNAVGDGTAIVLNGTLTLDYAPATPDQGFRNSLSGSGNLVTTGYYAIQNANESFSGTTTLQSGSLMLLDPAALGTSSVTVDGGSRLFLDFTDTFANALDGSGDLSIRGLNTDVTIARDNSGFTGRTFIEPDNSLTLQNINAVGNLATQEVWNEGTLVFDLPGTGSETFNPYITHEGDVVKNGPGTLILANANTNATYYSGSTTVNAGTLISDLATAAQVDPCGTDLIVAADATWQAYSRDQWVRNLTGEGNVEMSTFDLDICSGDFSDGTITGTGMLTKTGPDGSTILTVGNVSVGDLDHELGTLNIAQNKTVTLSGNATIRDGAILGVGANTALTADGTVTIGNGTTLNVTGYNIAMGTIVLIDADTNIASEFGVYTINGVDQTTTISLGNYVNTSPIVQRNKDDMTQIVISTGGLVWNNTAPGTAHGTFNMTGNATVGDDLNNNGSGGPGFGWDGKTLTKTGDGTLTLTGNNTYTGGTDIQDGKIIGTNAGAIGNGPINLRGEDTSVEYNVATDGTIGNAVSGTGSFVKSGTGTLVQTGANTYTGGTTVNGGSLVGNLPDASVDPPCGTPLDVAANASYRTYNTNVSISKLTGAGTVNMNAYDGSGNKNLTVCSGDFSKGELLYVDTLTKKSAGTFTVGSATVETLKLDEGTLIIAEQQQLTVTGNTNIADNTMLSVAKNPALVTGSMSIGGNNTILDVCGCSLDGWVVRSDNPLSGQFFDVYVGGNEVTGTVTIDQFINGVEVEYVNGGVNNPGASGIKVISDSLVWYNSKNTVPNEAHGTFDIATSFTVIQVLADRDPNDFNAVDGWDGKTLTKKGTGTLTLNAVNTYTGGTIIEAGRVVVKTEGALGNGGEVRNGDILEFDMDGDGTFANDVSGVGSFITNSTGTITMTGTNMYTGGTTVNSGTLVSNLVTPTAALPCGTALFVASGATYSPYNTDQFVSDLNGSGTVDMKSYDLTVCSGDFSNGLLTGVGTLTKTSPSIISPPDLTVGTVIAENLDLQIGTLIIAEGKTVALTGNAAIGRSTGLKVTAVKNSPALTAEGSVTIAGDATLRVDGYNASMETVVLIDAGSPIANDFTVYLLDGRDQTENITLANYHNTSALIQRDADDLSRIIVSTGGLVWNNTAPGTAHGTFQVDTDDTITKNLLDNTVSTAWAFGWDGKTLTKTDTGNLTLTGDNTYTGGTVIEQGTLTATNKNALGTGTVDIDTSGKLALDFDGTMSNTIEGRGELEIDGNVNIIKSNGGFHGNTTVTNGTTTLQRADGLGDSNIAIQDGTTLFFNMASDGNSANAISGTGNLIKGGAGTLTLGGDITYSGTTTIRSGTLVADLVPADLATLPCGAALTVEKGAVYQAKSREQFISTLSGTGIVDMQGRNLTVCDGDFTGGAFKELNNVTKKSAETLRTDGFDADNFTLREGTFILNAGQVVTLDGTADIQAGTILDIGAHLAFDVAGEVTIDPTATLNITGYRGSGSVVLIRSGTDITDHFGTYTINGIKVREQTPSLDAYYIVEGIDRIDNEILITDSHLAWNSELNDSAHGTFKIDSGTVTISDTLRDKTDHPEYWLTDENNVPLWDGVTLTKNGNGTLILDSENTYSGDTVINGGSVVATGGNSLGGVSGIVKLTDNDVAIVLNYTADGTFSKKVTGGGTIWKADDNTLTVVSDLAEMTGVFRQDDGTVIFRPLNRHFAGSYDQRGGTFEGVDGLTIDGDANFEGTVRTNGTLTVDRYVFLDGADFHVNLYANQADGVYSDRINSDTLTINDSVLHVNDVGVSTSYAKGKTLTFTILHTTDGISGDFTDVVGINTRLFNVDYGVTADGLDYTITLALKSSNPFGDYEWNHNTGQVGDALDYGMDDPDMESLITELLNRDDDGIREGIDQLRGSEIVADARTLALWSPWRAIFNRLDEAGTLGACQPCNPCVPCGSPTRPNRNAWVEGYSRSGDVSSDGNARSYDSTRGGVLFGIDTDLNSRARGGLVFGYGSPRLQSRFGKVEADDCTVGLYLKRRVFEKSYIKAFLGYGWQDYDFRRYDFGGRYDAEAKGDAMYASIELVRPIHRGRSLTLLPLAALDYQKSWSESLAETGGAYNQNIERGELDQLLIRVGLNGRYHWNDRLELSSRLQYACQVGGDLYGTAQSSFAMSANSRNMDLRGVDLGRDRLNAGIGGSWYLGRQKRTYAFGNYDFDCGVNDTAHTGQIGFATTW